MNHNQVHGDGHQFDDNYSVSPAAMSDEQIARRDAMSTTVFTEEMQAESSRRLEESFAGLAASALAIKAERDALRSKVNCLEVNAKYLEVTMQQLNDRLTSERDALRALLREMSIEARAGLRIPQSMIERAEKLLAGG